MLALGIVKALNLSVLRLSASRKGHGSSRAAWVMGSQGALAGGLFLKSKWLQAEGVCGLE